MNADERRTLLESSAQVTLDKARDEQNKVAAFWIDEATRVAAGVALEVFIEDLENPLWTMKPSTGEVTRLGFERFLGVVAAHFAEIMFKNNQANRELVEASSGSVEIFVEHCMAAFHPFGEAVRRNVREADDSAQYFIRLFDYAALGMWLQDEILMDSVTRQDASCDDRLAVMILAGIEPNYDMTHIKWFSGGLAETYKSFIAELELAWTDLAAEDPGIFSGVS